MKEFKRFDEVLNYNPDSGILTWKIDVKPNIKSGDIVTNINTQGYLRLGYQRKQYTAHRIAWLLSFGEWPPKRIDHINGDKTDNRLCNLRIVSAKENAQNMKKYSTNVSGHPGVHELDSGNWAVYLGAISLGTHESFEIAVKIRKAAEGIYGYHQNHGRQ